ncbi:hypothetical protein ACH5RR_041168 [Cinchona calisaya]|uniref:Peptidase S9 prolyl oligopeptidase catalytic domain-containing protein n=1 Tax=Cinchona calisaya TaxID=153742 RepID=A0ABD2XUQ0_9GENT
MPTAQKTPRIPTLIKLLLIFTSIAAMNRATPARILRPHLQLHADAHMLPPLRHFINSPTLSPSLVSSSSYKTKNTSFKLQLHFTNFSPAISSSPHHLNMAESIDSQKLRHEFLEVLRSRRTPDGIVPLTVEPGKPVKDPLYQETPKPTFSPAMQSCPIKDIPNFKELLKEENFYLTTEEGEQGRLPVLILSLKESCQKKRPAVVFLHSTNKCKEWLRPLLEAYASRGYVAVAIDSRYHGERASNMTTYRDALISSWEKGDTMPFVFDTVWDLIKLADYLGQREDIDTFRIGITGESLGGMHAWFAGAADSRYAVVVPIIGVQGFRWAIEHDRWQARVDSIKAVFEKARIDLGKSVIDKEVVEKVWDRIAPGLGSKFDSPYTVPAIAPRPLLILNGAEDPRCPLPGLEVPKSRAHEAYEKANTLDSFKLIAEPGIAHQMTPLMVKEASDWFDRFFSM